MKTLDEVIKNFEICRKSRLNLISCDGCTYADEDNAQCIACNEVDVLLYLRGYKEDRNDLTALRAYWAEQQANFALTWDELKAMEGKPVWIELQGKGHWKGWDVIAGFYEDDFGVAMVTVHNDDYYKLDLDKTWQVYRKERYEPDQKAN